MSGGKPMWRQGVDRVDGVLTPVAEGVVRHETFQLGLGVAVQLRRGVGVRIERLSRSALHALNLPAGSDINRLLTQIALVQREVRELAKAIEEHQVPRGRGADD